ncbi:MAG: Ig-like domain-containing protein [Chitinophagaceae bacterium]
MQSLFQKINSSAGRTVLLCILAVGGILVCGQFVGCAVMVPPSGGPKDSLPPVLVSAVPKDSTLHFTGSKIVLTFDEYVQLDNAQMNVIVSPNPKKQPNITNKLKTVTITIKDTLQPNTTYALNFGNSIKDVNEGNIFRNFTYAFSTGDHLDTDSITGKVLSAQTGGIDTTLIVMLHRNLNDTAVRTLRPDYYTTLDSMGNFRLRFLPPGDYNIFALSYDYAKQYRDSTMMFAFYDHVLHITDSTAPGRIVLYAYQQAKGEAKGEEKKKDTNRSDDGNNKKKKKKEEKTPALKMTTNLDNNQQDLLGQFNFSFDHPLAKFDSSKIILFDTSYKRIEGYTIVHDSTDTTNSRFVLQYPWKEMQYFKLVVDTLAALDSSNIGLAKIDTINFKTKDEAAYAGIRIRISDVDLSQNPVLQFFSNGKEVDSIALDNNKEVVRKLFPPGEYELRVLYDRNKNGRWDPGDYSQKLQPEIVERIRQKYNFKANWDNEPEIFLHGEPK